SVLERFFTERAGDFAGVVFTKSHPGSFWSELKKRLAYYGVVAFLQTSLRIMFNKVVGHVPSRMLKRSDVPQLPFDNVNSPEFIEFIKTEQVDLLVSIASMQIFRARLLAAPRLGVINYHTALLPRHRGRQPLFWALAEGDATVGITIHMVDQGIDTGDIILQREMPILPKDTLDSLYWKTTREGTQAILDVLDMFDNGTVVRKPQDPEAGNYNGFPTKADRQRFTARGRRFY
ncbi:MAG: formyltransferase family protein, partial [Verrucomicrobia bacterium]|nr:formyltransferase family protein [Verrucomicrobiota bacterium]